MILDIGKNTDIGIKNLYLNLMYQLPLMICLFLVSLSLQGQSKTETIYLWPDRTAPGFADKKDIPEQAKDWWVKSVHQPSITVFHPENPNGTAILILPGGGHKELVFDEEGTKAAKFLNNLGITAAVLKYRLFREEGSTYTMDHAKQDAVRAMKVMRNQVKKWDFHNSRVGLLGFSAGGELVNLVVFPHGKSKNLLKDTISEESSIPDFHMQIYPGPLG